MFLKRTTSKLTTIITLKYFYFYITLILNKFLKTPKNLKLFSFLLHMIKPSKLEKSSMNIT